MFIKQLDSIITRHSIQAPLSAYDLTQYALLLLLFYLFFLNQVHMTKR